MDTWYVERKLMPHIERLGKRYYCPLKDNRRVGDSNELRLYQRIDAFSWSEHEQQHGKPIHIKDFPKEHRVNIFRLVLSTEHTDYVATDDMAQDATQATQDLCNQRRRIEKFHRETKQVTGIDACQCRTTRSQHITSSMPSWSGFVSSKSPKTPLKSLSGQTQLVAPLHASTTAFSCCLYVSCVSPNIKRWLICEK